MNKRGVSERWAFGVAHGRGGRASVGDVLGGLFWSGSFRSTFMILELFAKKRKQEDFSMRSRDCNDKNSTEKDHYSISTLTNSFDAKLSPCIIP